jgi:hypothetical protein
MAVRLSTRLSHGVGHQRGFAPGREHELVERKIAKRQDQDHDDHAVHPPPGLRSDRLLGVREGPGGDYYSVHSY